MICFMPSDTRSRSGSYLSTTTFTRSPTFTHLGRVPDAAPRHVGDVQQAVDAAEVDEGAVVGDVLDGALEDDALLEHLERLLLERVRSRSSTARRDTTTLPRERLNLRIAKRPRWPM